MSRQKNQRSAAENEVKGPPRKSKKQQRIEQRQRARRNRNAGLLVLIALLAIAAVAVFAIQRCGSDTAEAALQLEDPALGPATAPVTIVEYGDFGCPACRAWHRSGIREALTERFGDQVRFVWKDFPVITPQSPKAAEAAQCAATQGKFWEYHDYLYENAGGLQASDLKTYASAVALDSQAFSACLDGGHAAGKVKENLQAARRLRLRGTPSFTFNGEVLPGPPSYQQLEQMIVAALP